MTRPRPPAILLSALVAHTAWHWMADRFSTLRQYQFQIPAFDLVLLAGILRSLMLVLILAGVLWALYGMFAKLSRPAPEREPNA